MEVAGIEFSIAMNSSDHDHPTDPQAATASDPNKQAEQAGGHTSFSSAFQAGCHDARERARATAPKVKQAAAEAVYEAAYSVAFGAIFASTLVREFLPRTLKDGLSKGAAAGRNAARSAADQWQPAGS